MVGGQGVNRRTGSGHVAAKEGDYDRAQASGVTCVPLLVETFGGWSPALLGALRTASEWRSNKLTASEYDETTWSARSFMAFAAQRISVAVQLSMAQEVARRRWGCRWRPTPARRERLQLTGRYLPARASTAA